MVYDFTMVDETGNPLFVVEGLEVVLHGFRMKPLEKRFDVIYRPTGISVPPPASITHGSASVAGGAEPEYAIATVPYVRGSEMDIQRTISKLDAFQPLSFFLFAEAGVHGDAAQGFSRSLRREYPVWTVRVAVFDATWSAPDRAQASKTLAAMDTKDLDVYVDKDGQVFAPRIEQVDPPSATIPLDTAKPWKLEDNKLEQVVLHQPADGQHVIVRVERVGPRHATLWTYVGRVDGVALPIVGVSSGPISSHLVVHRGSVSEINPDMFEGDAGPPLLAATLVVLVVLAADLLAFTQPEYLRGAHIVVVEGDAMLRMQIRDACAALGMNVLAVPGPLSRADLEACYDKKPQFILSGTQDAASANTLRSILAPRGRLLLWNHPGEGLAALAAEQPRVVGYALKLAAERQREMSVSYVPTASLLVGLSNSIVRSPDIFDPEKAYLLVGGIGSLGLHMALWMYEVRRCSVFPDIN